MYLESHCGGHGNSSDNVHREEVAEAQSLQDVKDLINHLFPHVRILQVTRNLSASLEVCCLQDMPCYTARLDAVS